MDGMRLDFADAQYILINSLLDFPVVLVPLLLVLEIRCIIILLEEVGELGLMMQQVYSIVVPFYLLVVGHYVDIVVEFGL